MATGGRLAAAALTAAGAVLALSACDYVGERVSYAEDATIRKAIKQVRIEGDGSGDVTITTGTGTETSIHTVVRYRGDRPDADTHRVDGDSLILDTDCGRHCSVQYRITMPAGVTVTGRLGSGDIDLTGVTRADVGSGSGDITIDDVDGSVTADTGSGEVEVREVTGAVTAETGSGDIHASGIAGDVDAETGSGQLDVRLAAPASVRAETGSGDVTIIVPDGAYRVTASSDSGDRRVTVPDQPGAPNTIDAHTGSGEITVRPA